MEIQKLEYLQNYKRLLDEIKGIFSQLLSANYLLEKKKKKRKAMDISLDINETF